MINWDESNGKPSEKENGKSIDNWMLPRMENDKSLEWWNYNWRLEIEGCLAKIIFDH